MRSMGRALDTPHEKLGEIIAYPSLLLSEQYMMNLFYEYANELPPYREYLHIMLNNMRIMVKKMNTVMLVTHLDMATWELFNPKKKKNIGSTACMLDIVSVGMPQINRELISTRTATWRHLSKSGDRLS